MRLTKSITILSIISSAIAVTNINTVINDIINLNAAVVDLTAATQAYQGGLLSAVSPAISFVVVEARLTLGVTDSGLLPSSISDSDTQDLIDTVASTLAINNPKAVSVLKSKKALFDASGQSPTVELGLQALLAGHLTFENNILQRCPADKVQGVQNVADIITRALQDGINTFAS